MWPIREPAAGDRRGERRRPWPSAIVPGLPQRLRGERERGLVVSATFASALLVAGFAWGSPLGAAMLALSALVHVGSMADAIRGSAFPGFGTWVPWLSAGLGVGAAGYVPLVLALTQVAFPVRDGPEGFLVDRHAYRTAEPSAGQWVMIAPRPDGDSPSVARVLAGEGQVIRRVLGRWTVDGRPLEGGPAAGPGHRLERLALEVPKRTILVDRGGPGTGPDAQGIELIRISEVRGRAWARSYPIWERDLLP